MDASLTEFEKALALQNGTDLAAQTDFLAAYIGARRPQWAPEAPDWTCLNEALNASQRSAISFALRAQQLALVHGPPGTGKTTAIAELIVQLAVLYPQKSILVCGASNLAVDNLLERVESKYELVIYASKRARQINDYYSDLHEGNLFDNVGPLVDSSVEDKPLTIALHEINEDKLRIRHAE